MGTGVTGDMSARDFLTRLWALGNDDRPGYLIGYAGPRVRGGAPVRSALFSTEGKDTVKARLLDPRKFLEAQLERGREPFRDRWSSALAGARARAA